MVVQLKQRLISAVAISFAGCAAWADLETDFSGSYFCTADAVGGVSFNNAVGAWESTRFKADSRHVLTITLWGKEFDEIMQQERNAYRLFFTEHGAKSEIGCYSNRRELEEINPFLSFISDSGWLSCKSPFGDLKVNLDNGRFLSSYTFGYVDGTDNNENTPVISIGTCSRIN